MGFYVNPRGQSKEEWLYDNCSELCRCSPNWQRTREKNDLPVCLVHNGSFNAAGICFSEQELQAFSLPSDYRLKVWFTVPIDKLIEVCPELEGNIQ